MRILYFGTVCDLNEYEKLISDCRYKPSVAPIVFESALLSGMKQNNAQVTVYSFPMIPSFPYIKKLWFGSKKEQLSCGYCCTWLKTINIRFFKQILRRIDGRRVLKKWIKNNKGKDCAILTYSIPPFLAKDIVKYSSKYGVKCFAVVADLLRDMYVNEKSSFIKEKMRNNYLKKAIALQGKLSGYIYLVEGMKDVINPNKPYIVMEGIADIPKTFSSEKATSPAIMYAGMIEEKYGILNLIKAFEMTNLKDAELWIFGSGNAENKVKFCADRNPKIRFWGRKSREEIINYEKQASLLINPRNVDDDFTKYSFPSKTMEYMLSGTPVLTTKLKGIPDEYYKYIYCVDDNSPETLALKIEEILNRESDTMTIEAVKFIASQKNARVQAKRVLDFITNTEEHNANKV